jgi:hypothetical protein
MTYWTLEEVTRLHILRRNGKTPLEISVILVKTEKAVIRKIAREKSRGIMFKKLRHKSCKYDAAVALAWRSLIKQGKRYSEIHVHPAIVSRVLARDARGEL